MANHIKSLHDETTGLCGATLGTEFAFKSVDAAVLNGIHEQKPMTCLACIMYVHRALLAGSVNNDEQPIPGGNP